jgi:hypothetical protein
MKNVLYVVALAWVLAWVHGAAGQTGLETTARYVDQSAVAVLQIDVERLDTDAVMNDLARTLSDAAREHNPGELGKSDESIKAARERAAAWRAKFRAAGGRELFFVVVFKPGVDLPVVGLAPFGEGAKADQLMALMKELPGTLGAGARVNEGVVVTGDATLAAGMPLAEPARGAELRAAFERAGEAPVRVAIIPSEVVRRAVAENIPTLPAEMGGVATSVLTEGVTRGWGSLSVPPGWSMKLVAESASEEAAAALASMLKKSMKAMTEHGDPAVSDLLLATLEPRAEGTLVVITAGDEKIERLKRAVGPVLLRAREAARRAITASNMRQQLVGCMIYVADNNNEWPASLDALVAKGILSRDMLRDGAGREGGVAFTYIRPDPARLERADWSKHVVLHETVPEAWPAEGVWVGFADGHVQIVTDEAWFKAIVEQSKKMAAK